VAGAVRHAGAMSDASKTVPTERDPREYVDEVKNAVRRRDAATMLELLGRVTGEEPRMWGPSIVGFGRYHYRYASGRQGDMAAAGFSPRAGATTVYLADGFEAHNELLDRLGPHTTGASCLYLKDLEQVDLDVLEELLAASYAVVSAEGFGQALDVGRR